MTSEITTKELQEIHDSGFDAMYDSALAVGKEFIESNKDKMNLGDLLVAVSMRAYKMGVTHGVHEASKRLYSDRVD